MDIKTMIYIGFVIAEALIIGIPSLIKIILSAKALKASKNNEEKMIAIDDMKSQAKVFIEAAEIAYKDINDVLRSKGSSAGSVKKDSVMLKLQSYASEKGYDFDIDFWSQEIDKQVQYTKNVNSK